MRNKYPTEGRAKCVPFHFRASCAGLTLGDRTCLWTRHCFLLQSRDKTDCARSNSLANERTFFRKKSAPERCAAQPVPRRLHRRPLDICRSSEAAMTKPRRSALPLPRYVERKPTKAGFAYFWHVPSWARKAGCPIHDEALGLDYHAAVKRAETILLPAFDAWRKGGDESTPSKAAQPGTLDWLFADFKSDHRFTRLDPGSKRNHENGFKLVGGYVLKDGSRLGEKRLTAIDTALVDELYPKLLVVQITDTNGNVIERKRKTTVNHAMKSCRRAWNICARRNPASYR